MRADGRETPHDSTSGIPSFLQYAGTDRREERKLNVPTIGNIYRATAKIVRYFNGLGVRFSNHGCNDSRHWLQRAWTLQEIANESTITTGGTQRLLDIDWAKPESLDVDSIIQEVINQEDGKLERQRLLHSTHLATPATPQSPH